MVSKGSNPHLNDLLDQQRKAIDTVMKQAEMLADSVMSW
jgi:hypothetical protein